MILDIWKFFMIVYSLFMSQLLVVIIIIFNHMMILDIWELFMIMHWLFMSWLLDVIYF